MRRALPWLAVLALMAGLLLSGRLAIEIFDQGQRIDQLTREAALSKELHRRICLTPDQHREAAVALGWVVLENVDWKPARETRADEILWMETRPERPAKYTQRYTAFQDGCALP